MTTLLANEDVSPAVHDEAESVQLDAADVHDYAMGEGMSTLTGKPRGSCLTGTTITPSIGGDTEVFIKFSETRAEFLESLGVESEVQASYGLAKASARVKFAESFKGSTFSSWLVVRVTVKGPVVSYNGQPTMSASALALLGQTDGPWKFMKAYGDRYVSKLITGGEFTAVLQIDSATETSKKELHAEWKASGGIGGLDVSTAGSIDKLAEKSHATNRLEFRCHVVGPRALPAQLDSKSVIDFALKFPATVTAAESATVDVVLQEYSAVTSLDVMWPNYKAAKSWSAAILTDIADLQLKSATARNIAGRAAHYGYAGAKQRRATYTAIAVQIDGDIDRLQKTISECMEAFFSETQPTIPARPSTGEYGSKSIPPPGNLVRHPKKVIENVQVVSHKNCGYLRLAALNNRIVHVDNNHATDSKQIWNLLFYRDNNECVMHVEVDGQSYVLSGIDGNNSLELVPFTDDLDDAKLVWEVRAGDMKVEAIFVLRRDGGRPLTIAGGGGWKAGDGVLTYEWVGGVNQLWHLEPTGLQSAEN